jgi:hypothetical protein
MSAMFRWLPGLARAESKRPADRAVGAAHVLLGHAKASCHRGECRPAAGAAGDEAVHRRG